MNNLARKMTSLWGVLAMAGLFLICMFGAAVAAETGTDPWDSVGGLLEAIKAGNWKMVAGLVLSGLMYVLNKYRDSLKLFSGDRGGAVLVMLLALGGGLATSLVAGVPVDLKMLLGAVGVAWTAVGGYTWLKRLIWPESK